MLEFSYMERGLWAFTKMRWKRDQNSSLKTVPIWLNTDPVLRETLKKQLRPLFVSSFLYKSVVWLPHKTLKATHKFCAVLFFISCEIM